MQYTTQQQGLSLKDIILGLQAWLRYLLSKWIAVLLCGLIGAGLGLTYALVNKPDYKAELTFVLEDNSRSGGLLGAYAGLASQFGLDLGNSGSGVFSGDNILEFLKSRLMVEKTLLSPLLIENKPTSLADYYISIYEVRKKWKDIEPLKDLHFLPNQNRRSFSRMQDSVLNDIYTKILNDHLIITKPDKKLSFISVECTSRDEIFSKAFTERLVKEATGFYVETMIKRSKTNVDLLQAKADSIEDLLNRKSYIVAKARDLNLNPARQQATVETEVVARDKMVLQTMYGEVIKNLELSKMTMAQEIPLIQIVDMPILPLEKVKFGKLKGLILGGFLGGFLVSIFLIIRKLYKDILADN